MNTNTITQTSCFQSLYTFKCELVTCNIFIFVTLYVFITLFVCVINSTSAVIALSQHVYYLIKVMTYFIMVNGMHLHTVFLLRLCFHSSTDTHSDADGYEVIMQSASLVIVFLSDASTCVQEEEGGIKPPTLRSMDDHLYLLIHSRPKHISCSQNLQSKVFSLALLKCINIFLLPFKTIQQCISCKTLSELSVDVATHSPQWQSHLFGGTYTNVSK